MNNNPFQKGFLEFKQGHIPLSEIQIYNSETWDDGTIAYSRGEQRWKRISKKPLLSELFREKQPSDGVIDGFAMEADLWRFAKDAAIAEELAIEREDDQFFFQKWTLHQKGKQGEKNNCFWKPVRLRCRSDLNLFNANYLECFEVIHWEHRLHVFLTHGEVHE